MTNTNFTQVGDHFYVGTVSPPPVTGNESDGDEYWQTVDGTTGTAPTEVWKFEEDTATWLQQPTGGGVLCPAPMTRGALIVMRNASGLNKDCHYVITDYNRGTVGAAVILLHALDANTLSQDAEIKVSFDNTAWDGRYDIDTNRIMELNDRLGNKVTGQEIVDTFPWGNTSVYDNIIEEGATFTYSSGSFFDNHLRTGAIVVARGISGNFARNVIGEDSNVTWDNGDFRDNIIGTDAVVNANTTGDFDNNEVHSFGRADVSGSANVDQNYIGQNSRLTTSAGSVVQNRIGTESQLTTVGGTIYENQIEGSSVVTLTTTRNFYQNEIKRNSTVVVGNHLVYASEFSATSVNTTGSSGNGIAYSKFLDSFSNATLQNIASLTIQYSTVSNNSVISANSASRLYMRFCTLENYGRILLSPGTLLDANYTGSRDYSYIQVQGGRLYVNYTSLGNVSYIRQAATVTGTNRVERCSITTQSLMRFLGTCVNCRFYYCDISSGGNVYHTGTSTGCYFYYCNVASSSQMYSNNSVNLRAYYNTVTGNSQYYSIAVTATHYAYYNSMSGHGYIRHVNATGGRIYAVHCAGQGLLQMSGNNAAGRIYYSSFLAYYYLFANNWTVTRTALHGTGRRSYTVTNPPANGTFTQNF